MMREENHTLILTSAYQCDVLLVAVNGAQTSWSDYSVNDSPIILTDEREGSSTGNS